MQPHRIVSREEWVEARKAHMAREKEFTRARDRLAEEFGELGFVSGERQAPVLVVHANEERDQFERTIGARLGDGVGEFGRRPAGGGDDLRRFELEAAGAEQSGELYRPAFRIRD